MMRLALLLLVGSLAGAAAAPAVAQKQADPDWPCVQRKVPSISLAQVWRGPPIETPPANWNDDPAVKGAVASFLDRRITASEAAARASEHMKSLAPAVRSEVVPLLVTGLLETTNSERGQIISGIGRYARKQAALASDVRREAVKLSELRQQTGIDTMELERRTQQFNIAAKMFQDRAQSLRYICEVPVELEQRLFAVLEAIRKETSAN